MKYPTVWYTGQYKVISKYCMRVVPKRMDKIEMEIISEDYRSNLVMYQMNNPRKEAVIKQSC